MAMKEMAMKEMAMKKMAMKKNLVISLGLVLLGLLGFWFYPDEVLLEPDFLTVKQEAIPYAENGYFKLKEAVQALQFGDEQAELLEK
jgi:hypothetical protein